MHWLTAAFLFFVVASTACRLWLSQRQIRHVLANRGAVPAPFDAEIGLDDHQKAADYSATRNKVGRVDTLLDSAVLVAWTVGGGLAALDALWRSFDLDGIWLGITVIFSVFLIGGIIALPLSIYRTFGVEARFGFNKTTPGLYVADLIKGLVLSVLLGTPLLLTILWLMDKAGSLWWLYAWMVWAAFSLVLTWAYPAFIAPLFNKFSPLSDEDLKSRIESLLERCGFRSKGVFVMDGSRRSSHGNAYFTGVGNNKRIVFFDTLIESLGPTEVEAVLAHELGHFRKNHVRKRLIVVMLTSLAGLALLGWLKTQPWFYTALGVTVPSDHLALLLFLMATPVFTYFITPLGSVLSRKHEFEADEYAFNQADAQALISALVKLYKDNATTLTPDPVHSGFYDSHPPAAVRVARLNELLTNA